MVECSYKCKRVFELLFFAQLGFLLQFLFGNCIMCVTRYFILVECYAENGDEENEGSLALANATEKVLQLRDTNPGSLVKRVAKSGAEFFVTRSYHGLEMHANSSLPEPYLVGRSGKASGYKDEKIEHET